jgi:hypothetical protein
MDAIDGDYRASGLFDEDELLAIEWAEQVTLNQAKYDKALWERLRARFNDQEIVELTMASAMFNCFNRIVEALHVELEPQEQVDLIRKSRRIDPDAFSEYVERANVVGRPESARG